MKVPVLDSLSPRPRKLALWILGLLIAYTILGFLILPPIIRAVAVKQLSKQLDREASIEKVKLNPYTLSVTVRGLLIKDKDGQPFVSWDEVYVNLQLVSFLGHTWVFKEISTTRPFVRVQMNKDYTFNFSDLITKFSTNAPAKEPAKAPSRPLALRIDRLHIGGAGASLTDLTPRTPFNRILGPLDVTVLHFQTDPNARNPYSIAGTTDAGEKFAWSGYFCLDPLRSEGEFSLENFALKRNAPLYQDLVRVEIKDGTVDVRSTYRVELSASNRVAAVTNTSLRLHSFKLAETGSETNIVELPEFAATGVSVDVTARQAEVAAVTASGARLALRRDKDSAINVVELAKPAEGATNAPGGILFLLRSVTNAVAMLLNSTNAWSGTIDEVNFLNGALSLEDLVNSRPARLDLDNITLSAKHISNVPGSNLTASLSLRWNTNGTIRTDVEASFSPPTVDIQLALDKLELRTLDPYLEPRFNAFVTDSKFSMDGHVRLRTTHAELPEVTFQGNVRLDDFSTVDGVLAEDLLKWGSVRISGIDANLNPPAVAVQEVAVDDAYARVIIETNHTINLLAALRLTDTNAPASPPAEEKPAKRPGDKKAPVVVQEPAAPTTNAPGSALPNISVATVVISNAQVRFTDRSFSPSVNVAIQQAGGTIAGLSSAQLHHADVNLHATVDNFGRVEMTGTINPFGKNQTNDLKIVVTNIDLTPTSPYVGKFAGYRLAKGKLDMNLAYHLYERQLKAENLVTLDQFTFGAKVNSPDATKLPVRLAIAILKDRDGKIQLDVPIDGSLDDPQFRLHKVIVNTLLNVLTKIATSPFSVLGALFGGKGEEISYQDFTPGSFDLLPASKEKLDALVKGLYERPALQLEIEGSVDPDADRNGLRHVALDKQLRTGKWMALRKSERLTTTADQVTLTPEERQEWLKELYSKALAKGSLAPRTNTTNATRGAIALPSQPRPVQEEKGATVLMHGAKSAALAPLPAAGAAKPGQTGYVNPMEQALMDSIAISDSDFEALASERAKAVRDYILQGGKVEAERVFLTESQPGGVKSEGSRAYLQLR